MNANPASPAPTTQASRGLNIALWIGQVLLAAMFGMAGLMKVTAPVEELAKNMEWVATSGAGLIRFIGISELAGAVGLLLPALTRIRPVLTPVAGIGLATIMVLAAGFHAVRGEFPAIGSNVVLGGLAAFIAWGRLKKAPFAPRA